jgi:hypothetical protein
MIVITDFTRVIGLFYPAYVIEHPLLFGLTHFNEDDIHTWITSMHGARVRAQDDSSSLLLPG